MSPLPAEPAPLRIKSLFLEALALPPGARPDFLARACAGDEPMLLELHELLSYHGTATEVADGSPSAGPVLDLPERVAGFRIVDVVGWGGMATVYLAEDLETHARRALKVLRPGLVNSAARARLRREAEALGRLDHPGIAKLLGSGLLETEAGARPYLVVEYIEGQALREHLHLHSPDVRWRLECLARVCDAVQYAHEHGVIHRDLKPENILVDLDGRPRVLDFGIARLASDEAPAQTLLTHAGQLLGTLPYMSPELVEASGEPVGARSDIYALGVIGYEMLAGRLPYEIHGDQVHRAVVAILTARPVPLGQVDPALAGNVEAIVARALEKRPADRYATVAAMAADLRAHLAGARVKAPSVAERAAVLDGRGTPGQGGLAAWWRGASRRVRMAAAGAAAVTLALLAAATFRVVADGASPSPEQVRTRLGAIYDRLGECDELIHRGKRTREDLLQALELLKLARRDVAALPRQPFSPNITRFIEWRMGEASYFLGGMDYDPDRFRDAEGYWKEVALLWFDPRATRLMDSTVTVYSPLRTLEAYRGWSGVAMAASALAFYDAPFLNLHRAALSMNDARPMLEADLKQPAIYQLSLRDVEYDRKTFLNELAATRIQLGAVADSLPAIEEGLRILRQHPWRRDEADDPSAYASWLQNGGEGYLARAHLTGRGADLDSAQARFEEALQIRTPASPRGFAQTRLAMSELLVLRARRARAPGERAAMLAEAAHAADEALEALASRRDSVGAALARVHKADVLNERAAGADLDSVEALVRTAGTVLSRDQFPLQFAELCYQRGRLLRARWRASGNEALRSDARHLLEHALASRPREADAHFARRVAREVERLR